VPGFGAGAPAAQPEWDWAKILAPAIGAPVRQAKIDAGIARLFRAQRGQRFEMGVEDAMGNLQAGIARGQAEAARLAAPVRRGRRRRVFVPMGRGAAGKQEARMRAGALARMNAFAMWQRRDDAKKAREERIKKNLGPAAVGLRGVGGALGRGMEMLANPKKLAFDLAVPERRQQAKQMGQEMGKAVAPMIGAVMKDAVRDLINGLQGPPEAP
jgi:hypothetical protein